MGIKNCKCTINGAKQCTENGAKAGCKEKMSGENAPFLVQVRGASPRGFLPRAPNRSVPMAGGRRPAREAADGLAISDGTSSGQRRGAVATVGGRHSGQRRGAVATVGGWGRHARPRMASPRAGGSDYQLRLRGSTSAYISTPEGDFRPRTICRTRRMSGRGEPP